MYILMRVSLTVGQPNYYISLPLLSMNAIMLSTTYLGKEGSIYFC